MDMPPRGKYNAKCDNRSGRRKTKQRNGTAGQITGGIAGAVRRHGRAGLSRRPVVSRAVRGTHLRSVARNQSPCCVSGKAGGENNRDLPTVRQRYQSADGSVRYLTCAERGEKTLNTEHHERTRRKKELKRPASVEAVFMPSEARQTICISTQAGCAVDCHFCMTAQLGLIRNLTAGEILAQVLLPLEEHRNH